MKARETVEWLVLTNIFADTIPCNAERVLKLNISTGEVSMIGPRLAGKNKWYGGLLSPSDGCIYGMFVFVNPTSRHVFVI